MLVSRGAYSVLIRHVFLHTQTRVPPPARYTTSAVAETLAGLYERKQYHSVVRIAQTLTSAYASPDIVRVALASIRKQQRCHPRTKRNDTADCCHFLLLARRLVALLDRRLVTASHLAKLLEIETYSLAPAVLPRHVHPWLAAFTHYGIEPTIHAFAILINAYARCGDDAYALWLYEGLERGSLAVAAPDGRVQPMPVPRPNAVAIATAAQVWCRQRQWPLVHAALHRIVAAQADAQRLVTCAVSALVDAGHVDAAEALWLEHGSQPLNDRALAKLVLGCTRVGCAQRAIAYFDTACAHARQSDAPAAHLTGLFNAVLRCILDTAQPGSVRLDLGLLAIAARYRIRFDVDTYSVLISHLSRLPACRDQAAPAMQGLFLNMCELYVPIDDMILSHLVPAWVHLDLCPLVTAFWRMHTQGRPERKVAQVRRHIMHQATRWELAGRLPALLV
ncbi:hypothetical protein GGI20_004202 [Coemansia sp. BCRC 34301]|nr:hypothetical protein GGI20_004202 [Coemansia sp. BCRC 34301]